MKAVKIFCVLSFCVMLGMIISCGVETVKEEPYVLTEREQALVELIYESKGFWESSKCRIIRYVQKNDREFLLVSYSKGSFEGFGGEPMEVFSETRYIIDLDSDSLREATAREYGSNETGIVVGGVSYDDSLSEELKREAIAKAVSRKSAVVNPAEFVE